MPPYYAASLRAQLITSPLLPSITTSLIPKTGPEAKAKADALQDSLRQGIALKERAVPWIAEGKEPGHTWASDTRLGFLGPQGDMPFMCVGVEAPASEYDESFDGKPSSVSVTPSPIGPESTLLLVPTNAHTISSDTSTIDASEAMRRGEETNMSITSTSSTDDCFKFQEGLHGQLRSGGEESGDARIVSPLPQPQRTSPRVRALTLAIDLAPACFNRSNNSAAVRDLKIDVFLNGQLTACHFIPARGKSIPNMDWRTSGIRIARLMEKAWVIRSPPGVKTKRGGATSETDAAFRHGLEQRWRAINEALGMEAIGRSSENQGHQVPSAEFLQSLAKMRLPNALVQAPQTTSHQFAILDLVITLGVGKKLSSGVHQLVSPQRMICKQDNISDTFDTPTTGQGGSRDVQTSDILGRSIQSPSTSVKHPNVMDQTADNMRSTELLALPREAVVHFPLSDKPPLQRVLLVPPVGSVDQSVTSQLPHTIPYTQQKTGHEDSSLRVKQKTKQESNSSAPPSLPSVLPPSHYYSSPSPMMPAQTARMRSSSWSFRESQCGAKSPVLDRTPIGQSDPNYAASVSGIPSKVAVVIPVRGCGSSLDGGGYAGESYEAAAGKFPLSSCMSLEESPAKKRRIGNQHRSSLRTSSSSPLARFADPAFLPEISPSSTSTIEVPVSNLQMMLSEGQAPPARDLDRLPAPKTPIQRLGRCYRPLNASPPVTATPSFIISDADFPSVTMEAMAGSAFALTNQVSKTNIPMTMMLPASTCEVVGRLRGGTTHYDKEKTPSLKSRRTAKRKETAFGKAVTPNSSTDKKRKRSATVQHGPENTPTATATPPIQTTTTTQKMPKQKRERKKSIGVPEQSRNIVPGAEAMADAPAAMTDTPESLLGSTETQRKRVRFPSGPVPVAKPFEIPTLSVDSIVGYATAEESDFLSVNGAYGVRQIGAEWPGWFQESEILLGMRFIVAPAWE